MLHIHPQYLTNHLGEKIAAVIPISEYQSLIEELEDLEDVRLYDEAKKEIDTEQILFSYYLKNRNKADV